MRIRSLVDKKGREIDLEKINLFIGPNNVGKSQILKDIRDKMLDRSRTGVILESIEYELANSHTEFIKEYTINPHKERRDIFVVEFIDSNLRNLAGFELDESTRKYIESQFSASAKEIFETYFSKTKVAYLDASSRLELANSVTPVNPLTQNPNSILQMLTENPQEMEYEKELQKIFHKAFGMSIKLDDTRQGIITFKVGKDKELDEAPTDKNEWIQAALSKDYDKDIPCNLKDFINNLNNSFIQNTNL